MESDFDKEIEAITKDMQDARAKLGHDLIRIAVDNKGVMPLTKQPKVDENIHNYLNSTQGYSLKSVEEAINQFQEKYKSKSVKDEGHLGLNSEKFQTLRSTIEPMKDEVTTIQGHLQIIKDTIKSLFGK